MDSPADDALYSPSKTVFDTFPSVNTVSEFDPDLDQPRVNQQGLLPNSVKSRHIEEASVTGVLIADQTITSNNLAESSVTTPSLNLTGSASQFVVASQVVTSTSFVGISPSVTVTVNPSGLLLLIFGSQSVNNTVGETNTMSVTASGANSIPIGIYNFVAGASLSTVVIDSSKVVLLTGLNPGLTLLTAQYKVTGGTGTFSARVLSAIPL